MLSGDQFEYNGGNFEFRKSSKVKEVAMTILKLAVGGLAVAVVLYLLFALFVNTDVEARLQSENKMYAKVYPEIEPKLSVLEQGVSILESKDNEIYRQIFSSEAPSIDPMNSLGFLFGSDTIPDTRIVSYTYAKATDLQHRISSIDANFAKIFTLLSRDDASVPPMTAPVREISFTQAGAGTGNKLNPFYHAYTPHNGIDFIVSPGTPIYAAGDGVVLNAEKSNKGLGNVIVIDHGNGFETRYGHLSALNVKRGQKVKRGDQIGTAGMTGTAFAPHLHYEVMRDGNYMDPVGFMYASFNCVEYTNLLYVATNTEQTLD